MPRILRKRIDNELAQFAAYLRKLVERELSQIIGIIYIGEYRFFFCCHFGMINTQRYVFLLK